MLACVVIIYTILIFPLFININFKYSADEKIFSYEINLFYFVNVLYGYIELIDEGIIVHVNNRKAILILYNNLISVRKKIEPLKDYHIFNLCTTIDIGILNDEELKLNFTIIYNLIFNIIGQTLSNVKPYLSLKSNINVYDKKNLLIFRIKTVFVLNILMITISLIKMFLEKVIYAIKYKTQSN